MDSMDAAIADYEREIAGIEAMGAFFPHNCINPLDYYDGIWADENELFEEMIANLPD